MVDKEGNLNSMSEGVFQVYKQTLQSKNTELDEDF